MSRDLEAYQDLKRQGKEIRLLASVVMLLEWDQETYMPEESAAHRSEQLELLSSLVHQKRTSLEFKNALQKLIDIDTGNIKATTLDERKKNALREIRDAYLKDTKLPTDFVKTLTKATSQGVHAWQEARKNNSFKTFLPFLEKITSLTREKTEYLGYKDHPYDALLDLYEPGMTTKKLDALFGELKPFLTQFIQSLAHKKKVNTSFLNSVFPLNEQMAFNSQLLKQMEIDEKRARLDVSAHPFCMGLYPTDIRLTTHLSSSGFFENISSVLHEGGHALYELGLPEDELGTPLSEYCSMGIHESQSRFWECFIGLGRPFWTYTYPKLQQAFPVQLQDIPLDQFFKAINQVEPSLIRVHADEVTYVLHIILRYEIEKEFFSSSFPLADLPEIWNEKMKTLFGIVPDTDSQGCLQDIHWSFGLIGYFPSYALGNIYASALFQVFQETFPDWEAKIEKGNFSFIKTFLGEKIHQYGREFPALTLLEKATGRSLTPQPYIDYLQKKYQNL